MIFVHDGISRSFFLIRHYSFKKIVIFWKFFMKVTFSSVLNECKYFKQEKFSIMTQSYVPKQSK